MNYFHRGILLFISQPIYEDKVIFEHFSEYPSIS